MGKGGGKHNLYAGLKTEIPPFPDKSTGLKGPSVDGNATRGKAAETPPSLGPRKVG